MLVPWVVALAGLVTTKRVSYRGATYGATIVPATTPGLPALVLLPPIGVGSDRTVRRLRPRLGTPRGSGRLGTPRGPPTDGRETPMGGPLPTARSDGGHETRGTLRLAEGAP